MNGHHHSVLEELASRAEKVGIFDQIFSRATHILTIPTYLLIAVGFVFHEIHGSHESELLLSVMPIYAWILLFVMLAFGRAYYLFRGKSLITRFVVPAAGMTAWAFMFIGGILTHHFDPSSMLFLIPLVQELMILSHNIEIKRSTWNKS